jgi:decaprenylphospho-beta-D-erythro-pentofuranosid-2-ulose 2-reductase
MTYGLPGMFLMADPARVGESVARAVERGRDVIYVPWFWRWILLAIRLVPERVFKRTRL